MRITIYSNKDHYLPEERTNLNDLLKPFWSDKAPEEIRQIYTSRAECFEEVQEIDQADICVLPMNWNYYVDHNSQHLVKLALSQAQQATKPFVLHSLGDFTANPPLSGCVIFEASGYRSRRLQNGNETFALPAFIQDYLELYCMGQHHIRPRREKPVVGFCGQAGGTMLDDYYRNLACQWRKLGYRLGQSKWEPPPFETIQFRRKILNLLGASPRIQPNFQIRRRYRAGYLAKTKDQFHPTRMEFVQNILDSDYTLCVRGGGNFSVRFYETLCLGRIPIFVDTDCMLPYDKHIDYRQYGIWIEQNEIPWIAEKVADFHAAISRTSFEELQVACRKLWVDLLSKDGFYRNYYRHFQGTI